MASIRASGFKSFSPPAAVARVKARVEFREWKRRFQGFYDAEADAYEFEKWRPGNMAALAKWEAEQASNTWLRQALRKDRVYKRNGLFYDPSIARQTMEELGLETYRQSGSPATSGRGGSGGFFRSKHWRPYDEPARRLNPIAAGGSGRPATGRGLGTALSRFGDAKGGIGQGGIFGASASRVRSAKEMLNNPATFFRRALIYYISDELGKGYTKARGWDKISYLDSEKEADIKFEKEGVLAAVGRGTAGTLVGAVGEIAKPYVRISAIGMAPFIGEANAARKFSLYEANTEWASSGFRGPSPYEIMDAYPDAVGSEIRNATQKAVGVAEHRFVRAVDRTIDRMQDALAIRGVGTIEQIKSRYRRSPDGQRALSTMLKQEMSQLNPDEIHKRALNKLKQQP